MTQTPVVDQRGAVQLVPGLSARSVADRLFNKRFVQELLNRLGRLPWPTIALFYFAALLAPLVFADLSRPFGSWDYLTSPNLYMCQPSDVVDPRLIFQNYLCSFESQFTIRPTATLLYNIQYVVFRGEFWAWYAVKIAAKVLAILAVSAILKKCGVSQVIRFAVATLLMFHAASFELMLFSMDGWLAFFWIVAVLALVHWSRERDRIVDITILKWWQYGVFLLAWFLMLGTKETAFPAALVLVLACQLTTIKKLSAWLRLLPCYVVLGFWAWRLAVYATGGRSPSSSVTDIWVRLLYHVNYVLPHSPLFVLAWIGVAIVVWSLVMSVRAKNRRMRDLIWLGSASAVAVLVFASIPDNGPAPRYVIPAVYMVALPIGLGLRSVPRLRPALVGFVAAFPLLTAADIYSQSLAYQQMFYEDSDIIARLGSDARVGYALAISGVPFEVDGLFGGERQGSFDLFFDRYGTQFYQQAQDTKVLSLASTADVPNRLALLTTYSPRSISQGAIPGISLSNVVKIEAVRRGDYGILESMTLGFQKLDRLIWNEHTPLYDVGTQGLTWSPQLMIYLVEQGAHGAGIVKTLDAAADDAIPPGVDTELSAALRQSGAIGVRGGTHRPLRLAMPVQSPRPFGQVLYDGQAAVNSGTVIFGVGDAAGNDLWNAVLPAGQGWQNLPAAPRLLTDSEQPMYLFFYVSDAETADFSIRNFKYNGTASIDLLEPVRRYGGLAR